MDLGIGVQIAVEEFCVKFALISLREGLIEHEKISTVILVAADI